VDSADVHRMQDCKQELHNLLKEEKLAGATLLIFANKQDLPGALSPSDIEKVSSYRYLSPMSFPPTLFCDSKISGITEAGIAQPCSTPLLVFPLTPVGFPKELDLASMGTRHWRIIGCSAQTGEGLLDGFDWLVNDIRSRIFLID